MTCSFHFHYLDLIFPSWTQDKAYIFWEAFPICLIPNDLSHLLYVAISILTFSISCLVLKILPLPPNVKEELSHGIFPSSRQALGFDIIWTLSA